MRALGLRCETGRFQETMEVELVNQGPVTILLDSRKLVLTAAAVRQCHEFLGIMHGMETAIRCRGLKKTYDGKVEAVRGLDLAIETGECFGLLGPNGAGKTTTIEILEGLLQPTSGEVEILGMTWQGHERELRERLGISLQETRLSEKLTVRETLHLFASFYRYPSSVAAVLDELSLNEKADAMVGKLSGGQKQRLAVATALVGNPENSCFSMSPRPGSIRRAGGNCGRSCASFNSAVAPCC